MSFDGGAGDAWEHPTTMMNDNNKAPSVTHLIFRLKERTPDEYNSSAQSKND